MKLSEFRIRCKIKIPSLKTTGITDEELDVIINDGVRQVNLLAKVYRGYTDFSIVADQSLYVLSTIAPTFQQMVTAGLWAKESSSSDLVRVIPRTVEWLNKRLPSWRSAASGSIAQYYYHVGNDLMIYPAMDTAVANGGRLHHLILPTNMGSGDHYPFTGSTVEITGFRPLDNAIIEYVRWQLAPSLDKETGEDRSYPLFLQMVNLGKLQIKAKPDAVNYYDTAISFST